MSTTRIPLAQTFTVKDFSAKESNVRRFPGVFLTKAYLYFSAKDPVSGVIVEIREVDPTTSYVTPRRVPFGVKRLAPNDINISTDGAAPTPVIFPTPIFLRNDIEYAITVKAENNSPNISVFTAIIGETDLISGERITKQPATGVLFVSSNGSAFQKRDKEDLKFNLFRAEFKPSTGTAFFQNYDRDFFTIANLSSQFTSAGEIVHGETVLTLGSTVTANVGETANGATSGTSFDVRTNAVAATNIINVLGTSNNSLTATPFTVGETVQFYFSNGTFTGQSATVSSQSTPTGRVEFFDPRTAANTFLFLANTSGSFVANTKVKAQVSGAEARIVSIDDLTVHRMNPHLEYLSPLGTIFTANGKFGVTTSTLDTAFRPISINEPVDFEVAKFILSKSNEISNLSSNKSAQIITNLGSDFPTLSPIVHLDRSTLSVTENIVNNDSTNEDTNSGGNALAKYVTKVVTLADGQDAEDLKAFVAAYIPSGSTIEMYYKILNESDEGPISLRNYVQMTQVTASSTKSDDLNKNDYKELEFTAPSSAKTGGNGEVQYTFGSTTFTGFKRFSIKIVLLTSNPANPPKLKDFRAIALQV